METSKCPKCNSVLKTRSKAQAGGWLYECGTIVALNGNIRLRSPQCFELQVSSLRAELARLKSEKEAETKRADEAEEARIDATESDLRSKMLLEDAEERLAAATSRAEALATGIESIHAGRIVLSQADNGEWGAVLGTRIVTGCETAAEAVLAALLPPAKEVEGGK